MTVAHLVLEGVAFPGVSREAEMLKELFTEVRQHFSESEYLNQVATVGEEKLDDACREASADNWDGYGGRAFSKDAYHRALSFLKRLPTGTPSPHISVEPDGEVAFEWYISPRRVLSISVGASGQLSFAGIFGRSTTYGREFLMDEIPAPILYNLRRLLAAPAQGT